MISKSTCVAILMIIYSMVASAQTQASDSIHLTNKSSINKAIIPIILITGGALLSGSKFEKSLQKDIRNGTGSFNTNVDDYLKYAPTAQIIAANAFGMTAKNHWFDQTKNLTMAIVASNFIVGGLKKITNKTRPNHAINSHAFPSGHTNFAFTTATVLYEEYYDTNPIYASSGFAFATATGALRMANNAHWVSDVLAGAGIGILVTEVIYYFDPIIRWNPFVETNKKILLVPQFGDSSIGMYFCMEF